MTNPIKDFRHRKNLSRKELAELCGLSELDIAKIEAGKTGIPGELQDYLAEKGLNVSEMASQQSAFIAGRRGRMSA